MSITPSRHGADDLNYRLGRAMLLHRFAKGNVTSADSDLRQKAANDLKEATGLTDKIIKEIDETLASKEAEIMQV